MAAGFQYFDSTMVGAPILRYGAGYWAAFLDYWLTGQGGWATEFIGTNLRAYRSGTGNRFRLRLDDTQALYARLRAYRSMSGISSGLTNPFPTAAQQALDTAGCRKSYDSAGTSAHAYWGVRTDRYIVVFFSQSETATASAEYRGFFQFGDVPSLCEADSHNTAITLTEGVDSAFYYTLNELSGGAISFEPTGASNRKVGFSGTPNGAVVSPAASVHRPFGISAAASNAPSSILTQRLNFASMVFGSSDSSTSPTGNAPRARLANVHQLFGAATFTADANYPAQDLVPFSIGPRTFLPIMTQIPVSGAFYGDCYLLETTDTDGAL